MEDKTNIVGYWFWGAFLFFGLFVSFTDYSDTSLAILTLIWIIVFIGLSLKHEVVVRSKDGF